MGGLVHRPDHDLLPRPLALRNKPDGRRVSTAPRPRRAPARKHTHLCPSQLARVAKLIENASHASQKYVRAMVVLMPMYDRRQ